MAKTKSQIELEKELENIVSSIKSLRERAEAAGYNLTIISRSEAHSIKDFYTLNPKTSSASANS